MKKRVLSLFMALALCFSMLPTAALAEEAGVVQDAANANSTYTTGEDAGLTGGKNDSVPDDTDGGEMQDGEADAAAEAGTHTDHCVCGKDSSTSVNGHTHSTDTTWTAANSLPNSAGSYYLTQPVSGDWTVPTGEVNLCLNGQTINGKITVGSGATLTLTDCTDKGKLQGSGSGSGVSINGGTFNLYGGTITGFVNGVEIGSHNDIKTGSSFTMYGGAITSNEAGSSSGGGVFLIGTTNFNVTAPSFTMHGGTISNNIAAASDGGGGGVYVGEKCSFTMDGGTITGNTATNGNGGGIYIHFNAGSVSISNATITDNKAPATGDLSYGHGGGIYSERGVTVKNVTITGNNSTFEGGGIYGKGAITLTDATVTGNNQYDVYYDGQESTTPELTISGSVKAGYYANNEWKLPIFVSGALSTDSVIRVGMYEGIKPGYGSKVTLAEPANGVKLRAENFEADAADYVTSLGDDGKVYLSPCEHEMDDTGYTCKKCHTQFDARIGESAYYQTLAKAFLNAWNGSTITLMRDVNLNGNCSTSGTITLDLHGKTITSEDKPIRVNEKLTVKDSSEGGGRRALNVKFLVASNGTLAVDDSYTGDISCVELWLGGALEAYTGTIQELLLGKEGNGTGYSVKLWKGNTSACTIGKITDGTTSKSLTVKDLLKTNHAKCELYGEKDGTWSIVDKSTKIVDLTGYTAYKVQFQECVHQCADDTVEKPVCSKCGKALVVKITATASDGKTKTAWFPVDSAIENGDGYVEAIQTLNGWSAEGYTDATLMPLCDAHDGKGGIGIKSVTLTGKLTVDGGKHLIYSTTIASDADVTFKTGRFYHITVNGKASFVGGTYLGGVTASSGAEAVFSGGAYQYLYVKDGGTAVVKNSAAFGEDVEVTKGTLTVEGGSFKTAVVVKGDGTMNVNGGSFTGTSRDKVTYDNGAKGTISGGSFAELYLYGSGTAWLAGGSFTKLSTASSGALSSLLADGAAYYDQSGNAISNSAVPELSDVTVKTHAHTVDKETGICSVCKKQMAASLTAGNETSWYLTLDAAIKAANEGNGEKTLKLYQDVATNAPSYELTHGPVTLDVNGKKALGGTITVKGIQLTVTGEGTIWGVTASGSSAVVKNSTVNINYITAENGGRLELGGGSYMGLTVNNDGSSASLSGGTYKNIKWGQSYVPANEYLADGYGYKTSGGTWEDGTGSVDNVTVTPAPIKSTKVYPNSETNYSGSTFDAKDTSVTLTVSVTSDESAGLTYIWCRSINDEWRWLTNSSITQNLTEKYTGAGSQTLSITELPAGQTFSYKVQIATGDGYKCYSEPFTVTRHQHSWTYSAEGATITAKCTAEGCYLTDKLGGTFTISAPAANTLTYDGSAKEATAKLDAVSGVTSLPTVGDITYAQNGAALSSAPVNAGEYTASITVGEGENAATASVKYSIQKANPVVTEWPTISASVYVNNEAILTGGSGEGTFAFKAEAAKSWDSAGNKTTTVVFTPTDTNNYNELTQNYTVPVVKRKVKSCNMLTGITDKPCGTAQGELGLPGTVTITTEDGKTFDKIPVTWSGYDPNTLEEQTLTGTLDLTSIANEVEQPSAPVTAQIKVKLTPKSSSGISAAAYEGVYDGNEHGIILTGVPSGATVKYGESADSCTRDSLTYTDFTNGAKTVYYKVSQSGYADASGSATVNITKRPLTVTGITVKNKTYDGKTDATVDNGGSLTNFVSGEALVHNVSAAFADKNAGIDKTVNLTITLTASGATKEENYTISDDSQKTATANITTKEVTLTGGINATDRSYVKDNKTVGLTKGTLTFTGLIDGETLGANIPATGTIPDAKVGSYNVTYSGVTLADGSTGLAANYELVGALPEITVEITKANYGNKTASGLAKKGASGTVDLSALIVDGGEVSIGGEPPADTILSGKPTIAGTKLNFTFKPEADTNKTETVTVKVTSTNYEEYTITVKLTVTEKDIPTLNVQNITVAYTGERVSEKEIKGTAMFDGKAVEGTWRWKDTEAITNVADSGPKTVLFTPSNNTDYAEAQTTITVTIKKAKPTGAPKYDLIKEDGKKLGNANLTIGNIMPAGTIAWKLDVTTKVEAGVKYEWVFTPQDTTNYELLSGTVVLYTKSAPVTPPGGGSSGGGGGSSRPSSSTGKTDTTTTTKPDGTKVQTETKADGTKIQTETKKDGSVTKTTTNPNGSSVTETKAADGSTGTVKTDKNGNTEAETKVSAKAVEDAKKSGEAVKAPVEVEATRNSNTAPVVKVELPGNSGETKVEIPVSNVKPGTVAVLVHPDGTEEIVKNSLPTEDGIQLTVNGGATVKIVDNSKDFIDTRNHWAKDAIDFVSARGLVNGMSATIYAPDASTTRAQLWTILARQNNADLTGGNTWFENAQNWAKEKGISDGANPNGTINRAQMVTMLWRAMGQSAAASGASFADVPADSYYAQAVAWAVENGITAGVGNGRFDPNSTCTRAQIATFLWRAMAE